VPADEGGGPHLQLYISHSTVNTMCISAMVTSCPGMHVSLARSAPPRAVTPAGPALCSARWSILSTRCRECVLLYSSPNVPNSQACLLGIMLLPADITPVCCPAALQSRSGLTSCRQLVCSLW
jgi:hypothetical protein